MDIPKNSTDFEDAWKIFTSKHSGELDDETMAILKSAFFSGAYGGIGVLSNRLAKLPGAVEPQDMVKDLINTIQGAATELEKKVMTELGMPHGSA